MYFVNKVRIFMDNVLEILMEISKYMCLKAAVYWLVLTGKQRKEG